MRRAESALAYETGIETQLGVAVILLSIAAIVWAWKR